MVNQQKMAHTLAILGLGLMGSSVARAVRANVPELRIHAYDPAPEALALAMQEGFADAVFETPQEAVHDADIILLAAPISKLAGLARVIAPQLAEGALVMDIASVKAPVAAELAAVFPAHVRYIPAHPIAGSEKTGAAAGSSALFEGKRVVLCPESPEALGVEEAADFWRKLHAEVVFMPADLHDRIYGCLSHFTQFLAFEVGSLYDRSGQSVATAPAEFMRLVLSSPALWAEIFEANKINLFKNIDHYLEVLHQITAELREGAAEATPAPPALLYGELFPYLAATALISTAYQLERELQLPIKPFAGPGFIDFTSPSKQEPEGVLSNISAHALSVADVVDQFAASISKKRYNH